MGTYHASSSGRIVNVHIDRDGIELDLVRRFPNTMVIDDDGQATPPARLPERRSHRTDMRSTSHVGHGRLWAASLPPRSPAALPSGRT